MNDNEVNMLTNLLKEINISINEERNVPLEMIGKDNAEHMTNFLVKTFAKIMDTAGSFLEFEHEKKKSVTENETDMMADEAKDWGYTYILEHYDRTDIQEMGSSIYQEISEKVYQYIRDTVINEYDFSDEEWDIMYDAIADLVYERVDFSYIWEAIDEVLDAPVTFEEKLAEVGMSIKDFL